ncbi:hypothetical protein CVT25_000441 [Psilocybe cyanescens]|uniref:G domain-containing protein n=1 Tax=Psilocybe cyanescens TaxID=93625 RepID=A0A409XM47_PSICY|nr:hypothetical protein CVT25_000441 [Psilocybe cyanescens]
MMKPSVMGRSGAGKSTFINRVLEGEYGQNLKPEQFMKTEVTLKRCTTVVSEAALKADSKERRIILVDTPGFDGDDNDFDANHNPVSMVANWLKDIYSRPKESVLVGIIYLHDISHDSLVDDGPSLQILRAICGAQNFDRIVIGTTKWDKETANGTQHVKANELESFFQIVKGAKFGRNESTAKDIVVQALAGFSSSANLQIQLEMVQGQKVFSETAAGVYYNTHQLNNIANTLLLTSNKETRGKLERRKRKLEKTLKSSGQQNGSLRLNALRSFSLLQSPVSSHPLFDGVQVSNTYHSLASAAEITSRTAADSSSTSRTAAAFVAHLQCIMHFLFSPSFARTPCTALPTHSIAPSTTQQQSPSATLLPALPQPLSVLVYTYTSRNAAAAYSNNNNSE